MAESKCACGATLIEVKAITSYVYRSEHRPESQQNTSYSSRMPDGCRVRFSRRLSENLTLPTCPECGARDIEPFKFERTDGEPAWLCPKGH